MKLRAVVAILAVGFVGVTVGCVGGAKAEKQGAQAGTPVAAASPAAAASGEIGIPECDNYMTKYRQCVESKVPDAMKATMRQSFDQATAAWKQAASSPEARASLASACQQANDAAKAAMQAYGCAF